jgi:hypothetical protein
MRSNLTYSLFGRRHRPITAAARRVVSACVASIQQRGLSVQDLLRRAFDQNVLSVTSQQSQPKMRVMGKNKMKTMRMCMCHGEREMVANQDRRQLNKLITVSVK